MSFFSQSAEMELKRLCNIHDNDKNGYVAESDLLGILCEAGFEVSEGEIKDIVKNLERNEDGKFQHKEFIAVFLDRKFSAENLNKTINVTKVTQIKKSNIHVTKYSTKPSVKQQIDRYTKFYDEMDTDNSGDVSLDEFRVVLEKKGMGASTEVCKNPGRPNFTF